MESEDTAGQYFAIDTRLESFQVTKAAAKRKSLAKGKGAKALTWPHKFLDPADLSRAGFYFDPTPEQPDNVVCFLCDRRLGGWEEGDSPYEEHLRLSPNCGWAIVTAIEIGLGDYCEDDPASTQMVEARKATFAERWPHEGKKGWKPKTKQLVEAGWKYTPAPGYEDMATCTYCSLALDGWEPKDNPMNEHHKRSPNCKFFVLTDAYQQAAPKKTARGKAARASKASRLSTQSTATAQTDVTASIIEPPAEYEDSMTTASVATTGGTKKPRAKKATTAKGRKTKAKKEEPVEVLEDAPEPEMEAEAEAEPELVEEPLVEPSPPPAKPKRGKKRASDQLEESTLLSAEVPQPKKRATRTRPSKAADVSIVAPVEPEPVPEPEPELQPDVEMQEEAPAPAPKKKGRPSKAKPTRKTSTASIASVNESFVPPPVIPSFASSFMSSIAPDRESDHLMDEVDIERQLEADLDRPLTDDEDIDADMTSVGPAGKRKESVVPPPAAKPKAKKATSKKSSTTSKKASTDHHAMFDPSPVDIDEDDIEEELRAMETDAQEELAQVEEPEPEPEQEPEPEPEIVRPKKAKAGTRKVSKQTKKALTPPPPAPIEPEPMPEPEPEEELEEVEQVKYDSDVDELAEGHEDSILSNATATSKTTSKKPSVPAPAPGAVKRNQAPKKSTVKAARLTSSTSKPVVQKSQSPDMEDFPEPPKTKKAPVVQKKATAAQKQKALPPPPPAQDDEEEEEEAQTPATPPRGKAKTNAKQATISPSQSPQSSDAENQPPSSKPSATAESKRFALAPVATTPQRMSPSKMSPSKRGMMGGLVSEKPWSVVDVEAIFEDLEKENANGTSNLLTGGDNLSSPEKKMTVEEWIYFNASQAEQKLKYECEAVVSAFEREGARAMQSLEGLVAE